jgi:hypothetical protein
MPQNTSAAPPGEDQATDGDRGGNMSELVEADKMSHPGRLLVWHDTVIAAQSELMVHRSHEHAEQLWLIGDGSQKPSSTATTTPR